MSADTWYGVPSWVNVYWVVHARGVYWGRENWALNLNGARKFGSKEKAESKALLVAIDQPNLIGKIEVHQIKERVVNTIA
jgi:hypothetical protein